MIRWIGCARLVHLDRAERHTGPIHLPDLASQLLYRQSPCFSSFLEPLAKFNSFLILWCFGHAWLLRWDVRLYLLGLPLAVALLLVGIGCHDLRYLCSGRLAPSRRVGSRLQYAPETIPSPLLCM